MFQIHSIRNLVFLLPFLFITHWVTAQTLQPLYRAAFNEAQFNQTGWNTIPSGSGEYQPASITIGAIPINTANPSISDGRGIILTAVNGQGSLLYGPAIFTGDYPVLLRLSIYALTEGGSLAVGALDIPPNGTLANTDGSVTYMLEQDTKRYTGNFSRISVIYRPKRKGVIPLFQLAAANSGTFRSVTVMFDNFEIYSLGPDSITDPVLLDLFDSIPIINPTPTPVYPTPTPTQTPIPALADIGVYNLLILSPTNDHYEGHNPRAVYDQADQYAEVAQEQTYADAQGVLYQDILLREINTSEDKIVGPITVNETFQNTNAVTPDIAIDSGGIRHIIWSDNRTVNKLFSIYLAEYNSAGKKVNTADFRTNITYQSTNTANPRLAVRNDGSIVAGWTDDRSLFMDLFVRRLQ